MLQNSCLCCHFGTGEQTVDNNKSITDTFEVPYEPGTLTARCYDDGKETASKVIKTTVKPPFIWIIDGQTSLSTDRNDLSYVTVDILDSEKSGTQRR